MAKDINSNKPRGAQKKDDDSAVLKIMIALLLLVFSVFIPSLRPPQRLRPCCS